jgi:hypothetical protein
LFLITEHTALSALAIVRTMTRVIRGLASEARTLEHAMEPIITIGIRVAISRLHALSNLWSAETHLLVPAIRIFRTACNAETRPVLSPVANTFAARVDLQGFADGLFFAVCIAGTFIGNNDVIT